MVGKTGSVHPAQGPSCNGGEPGHPAYPTVVMTPGEAEFFLGPEAAALLDKALSGKSRPLRLRTKRD